MATGTPVEEDGVDGEELNAFLATLANTGHLAIFRTLAFVPGMGSTELAARLDLPPAAVRRHLRALMELGMVHVKEREVRRGVQKLYFANTRPAWITEQHDATLSPRQRQTIDLNILRSIVADARRAIGSPGYGARPGRMVAGYPATVDVRAWRELSELQHETLERMTAIIDAGRARQSESGTDEEAISLRAALLLMEVPARGDEDDSL